PPLTLFTSASSPRTVLLSVKQPSRQVASACGASANQASASGMSSRARGTGDRLIDFLVSEVFVFIKQTFPFSRLVNCATAGLKEGKKLSGEALSPGFRPRFLYFLPQISRAWQDKL